MRTQIVNYSLAFIEGLALIASPCILPILPIMLSGTIEGGSKRPLGIILGFVLTFAVFTFFSSELVALLHINLDIVRNVAFGLIMLFGLILVSDTLSERFEGFTQKIGNVGARYATSKNDGFFSGIALGSLVSLIWVPCAGPILAAAIVQTAIQKTTAESFLVFFFFALGSAMPMLFIALLGRYYLRQMAFLKSKTGILRKIFGVIIIISAAYAITVNISENYTQMPQAPNVVQVSRQSSIPQLINGLARPYPAPALKGNNAWINSPPLTIEELKGKVVLIDFWTYSCINCVRTLPYLKTIYEKYHDKGFEIIGVHTPEFEFEKNLDNVKKAVASLDIKYPVALDNDYATWLNYKNQAWPAHYLIDKQGNVVYEHFGEGEYNTLDDNIRYLLGLNDTTQEKRMVEPEFGVEAETPETYLGYARAESFAGSKIVRDQMATYTASTNPLAQDYWRLQGSWKVGAQQITSGENSVIQIHFFASKVYVVAGTTDNNPVNIKVTLDGAPLLEKKGKDVLVPGLRVKEHRLYHVVNLPKATSGILELTIPTAGVELYTFTFG